MKWILVGNGIIVLKFIKAFRESKEIMESNEIVGILGINTEKVKAFAKKFDIPNSFTDMNDIDVIYDAVYLGVPNILHYRITKQFLNKGINVLCEKPLVDDHSKAVELFKLAKEKKVRLLEAFMHINNPLYFPYVNNVKDLEANYSTFLEDIKNGNAETSSDKILKRDSYQFFK